MSLHPRALALAAVTAASLVWGGMAAPAALAETASLTDTATLRETLITASPGSTGIADNLLTLDVDQPDGMVTYLSAPVVMSSHAQLALQQIRDVRSRAWDANPEMEFFSLKDYAVHTMTVRDAAAFEGLNTREEYLAAITWDRGLEHAVIQRAAEENQDMTHERPDGSPNSTVLGPEAKLAENLTTADMEHAVQSFLDGEWDKLLAGNYAAAGHVTSMLNPAFRSFAQAQAGAITAQEFAWAPQGTEPASVADGSYRIPVVMPLAKIQDVKASEVSTYVGDKGIVSATLGEQYGDYEIPGTYSSSDSAILSVHPNGEYENLAVGSASLILTPVEMRNNAATTAGFAHTQVIDITERPAGSSLGEGSSEGPGGIVGIVLGVLGLLVVALPALGGLLGR